MLVELSRSGGHCGDALQHFHDTTHPHPEYPLPLGFFQHKHNLTPASSHFLSLPLTSSHFLSLSHFHALPHLACFTPHPFPDGFPVLSGPPSLKKALFSAPHTHAPDSKLTSRSLKIFRVIPRFSLYPCFPSPSSRSISSTHSDRAPRGTPSALSTRSPPHSSLTTHFRALPRTFKLSPVFRPPSVSLPAGASSRPSTSQETNNCLSPPSFLVS